MADYVFPFEKLEVWKLSKAFATKIYKNTENFPNEEKFGLVSQLRRAAVSVASNLAEGSSRKSKKDQAHFSQIAYSSLMEVLCQLEIARDIGYISKNDLQDLRSDASKIAYMINSLRRSQTC
ncbi:four helix bundle protein [Flexistipes sp.]|uniref:four helix bundle protein n=1 Tax=Flexistipes sp. TaxID=3088135 RepID=UPI003FA59EBD